MLSRPDTTVVRASPLQARCILGAALGEEVISPLVSLLEAATLVDDSATALSGVDRSADSATQ